jgi:hypothetical protein
MINSQNRHTSMITDDEIDSIISNYYRQRELDDSHNQGEINTTRLLSSMSKTSPWTRGRQSFVR